MEPQGVPNAPEAPLGAPDSYFFDIPPSQPLPKGVPAPEVLVSPDHTCAYAANCKRTLHYVVNGMLLAKRDHILHHIGRLRAMTLEVAHTKGVVEREVKSEASELLARLNASESLKQMRIQREVDELARHADAINVLAAEVDKATSAEDALTTEFLGRYRAMYDACDRLARRPLPDCSDLDSSDFEREARMYTAASKERDALSRLIAVKDNMIWTLVEERQSLMEEVAMLKEQKQELVGVERDEGDDQVATVKETGEDEDTNPGDADGLSVEESELSEASGSG